MLEIIGRVVLLLIFAVWFIDGFRICIAEMKRRRLIEAYHRNVDELKRAEDDLKRAEDDLVRLTAELERVTK